MEGKVPYDHIAAMLSGEANIVQINELKNWVNESPEHRKILDQYMRYWAQAETTIDVGGLDARFDKIMTRLEASDRQPGFNILRKPSISYKAVALVSVLALMVVIFYFFYQENSFSNDKPLSESILTLKENPVGQKSKIFLPDGSIVWLNSASKISYDNNFGIDNRDITLDGEAFFEVERDADMPFHVHTRDFVTEVLGTSFDINSFEDNSEDNIALVTGRIRVHLKDRTGTTIQLDPGEALTWNEGTKTMEKKALDYKEMVSWKDGLIYFKQASFKTVIDKLERWYGVEFITKGDIPDSWRFTGEFENEYLNNVLLGISHSEKFDYTIEGKKIYVQF